MKTFQNNYTTPEQSKKLLELGIPAESADCYYYEEGSIADDATPQVVPFGEPYEDSSTETMFSSYVCMPCWSVGRLIEIAFICSVYEIRTIDFWRRDPPMDDILYEFENNKMDYSKLDDE